MSVWEITNEASLPAMICAADGDISDSTTVDLIKKALKRAKREGISVTTISVSVQDEDQVVTLCGTYGASYR